jgi:hypothetical protein
MARDGAFLRRLRIVALVAGASFALALGIWLWPIPIRGRATYSRPSSNLARSLSRLLATRPDRPVRGPPRRCDLGYAWQPGFAAFEGSGANIRLCSFSRLGCRSCSHAAKASGRAHINVKAVIFAVGMLEIFAVPRLDRTRPCGGVPLRDCVDTLARRGPHAVVRMSTTP